MKTRIVIDSSCDTKKEVREQLTVVPLRIHFGEEEYIDGVTITHNKFYEMLIESDVLPKTSQASPALFMEVFEEAVNAGESVVVVTLASKLSGTYQSAMIAAADYPGRVFVVDSESAAIGAGILVELGLRLAKEGIEAESIAAKLEEEKKNICLVALLDTLEYLQKGGRISKTAAIAGGLLSIKPVITIREGEIVVLGKARGSKQGNNLLVKEIETNGVDFEKPILLGYTGITDALLQKYIQDSAFLWEGNVKELHSTIICSVIGTHAGPGAIAAAFFKKKETFS